MSVLSASYEFVPQGLVTLQRVGVQGLFSAQCLRGNAHALSEIGTNGSCVYLGNGNVGAITFFAATVPLTAVLSFAIQLLQHKYDAFFLVTQTHLQWLTDNVPVASVQCETTHEQLRRWWELREFFVNEKLPVLYRFASPGFAFVLVLDAALALALVLEDLASPGSWHTNPPVMVLSVHVLFITAFLLKSCWRLYTCATLQASHVVKLQYLKGQQLAKIKLAVPAVPGGEASDAQAVAAGMQHALVFAEEIEARIAYIRVGDHVQKILGVKVTPQKLVLVLGYFVSGLVTLMSSTAYK
jgi:hypothetical protein